MSNKNFFFALLMLSFFMVFISGIARDGNFAPTDTMLMYNKLISLQRVIVFKDKDNTVQASDLTATLNGVDLVFDNLIQNRTYEVRVENKVTYLQPNGSETRQWNTVENKVTQLVPNGNGTLEINLQTILGEGVTLLPGAPADPIELLKEYIRAKDNVIVEVILMPA